MFFRRNGKFNNCKVIIDGVKFDSKKEAAAYQKFKLQEAAGDIRDLEVHPVFVLQEAFTDVMGIKHRPITYIADFRYFDCSVGKNIIVDVKANKFLLTEVYKLKKKLFLRRLDSDSLFMEMF